MGRVAYQAVITADWVRGFADRSSQLITGEDVTPAIVMTAGSDQVLRPLLGWLKRGGWEVRLSRTGARWTLRISGLEQLRRWAAEIGFVDPEKQSSLNEVTRVPAP